MTIATQEPRRGGRPKGSVGNGKTVKEKLARIDNQRAIASAELEAQAERARAEIAIRIAERKQKQAEAVLQRYEGQEARRTEQVQIDQPITLKILIGLAVVTFITTAVLTADGTIGSAAAAQFASPVFSFILFGAFEVAILAFMLMYYVLGSRVEYDGTPVKATRWFVAMIVASSVTVGLSLYHVLDVYDYAWTSIDMWVGVGIRVIVALFFVVIAKGIASTIFAKAIQL